MNIIFVVGFPRSGTTFLQSLLCTQPGVVSLPETHFFTAVTGKFKKAINESLTMDELGHCRMKLKEMMDFEFSEKANQDIDWLVAAGQLQKRRLFEILLADYFKQNNVEISDTTWIVEKTPDHARRALEILEYFPEAKFIGIVRHPVDAIVSFYTKLVKYRKPFYTLARQWRKTYRVMLTLPEEAVQILRYEDLKNDPPRLLEQMGKKIPIAVVPENWKKYRQVASQLIMPHETWKDQNTGGLKAGTKEEIPLLYRYVLQLYLRPQMKYWSYSIK